MLAFWEENQHARFWEQAVVGLLQWSLGLVKFA